MLTIIAIISFSTITCVLVHQIITRGTMFTGVTDTLINILRKKIKYVLQVYTNSSMAKNNSNNTMNVSVLFL